MKSTHPFVLFSYSVLFYLLGLMLLAVLGSNDVSGGMEHHDILILELIEDAPSKDIDVLLSDIKDSDRFNHQLTEYINPKQALERYGSVNDVDNSLLENNPFYPIVVVGVKHQTALVEATEELAAHDIVQDIYQESTFVNNVNGSLGTISIALGILFVIVSILVITILVQFIKITLQEKAEYIELMSLSGAYRNQISRPFLIQSLKDALLSSLMAIVLLVLTFLMIGTFTGYNTFVNAFTIVLIAILMVLSAIVILTITTYMIVTLYLSNI